MFLARMEVNLCYDVGRSLTYIQFPGMFTYDPSKRRRKPRQQCQLVGRLNYVPLSCRELYYMRLLLNVQVSCTSFEDIQTVEGHVFYTYHEACVALGLSADDQ
jgi:hypothetical protein